MVMVVECNIIDFVLDGFNNCMLWDVFGWFVMGVIIVIVMIEDGLVGIIVNSFLLLLMDLFLVLWLFDKNLCWYGYFV